MEDMRFVDAYLTVSDDRNLNLVLQIAARSNETKALREELRVTKEQMDLKEKWWDLALQENAALTDQLSDCNKKIASDVFWVRFGKVSLTAGVIIVGYQVYQIMMP